MVVDYSTTWCGPCKMVLPKFEALASEYGDAIFLKVRVCPGGVCLYARIRVLVRFLKTAQCVGVKCSGLEGNNVCETMLS